MDDLIYLGKITSIHGIKGELKIKSDFELKERVFVNNFNIYIDRNVHTITSYRTHKQYDMITIDNIYDINAVYKYVGKDVYIKRKDLGLKKGDYLYQDLIGMELVSDGKVIGKVINLINNKNNLLLDVRAKRKFYVPFVKEYIKIVDLDAKKIYTENVKDLLI